MVHTPAKKVAVTHRTADCQPPSKKKEEVSLNEEANLTETWMISALNRWVNRNVSIILRRRDKGSVAAERIVSERTAPGDKKIMIYCDFNAERLKFTVGLQ